MTNEEWTLVQALARINIPSGTFAKRFVHSLCEKPQTAPLSPKQSATLYKIAQTYRRQVNPRFSELVIESVATELSAAGWLAEQTPNGWRLTPPTAAKPKREPSRADLAKLKAWNEGKPL